MKTVALSVLLFYTHFACGQYHFTKVFDKRYGTKENDQFHNFVETQGGGFLLCGTTRGTVGADKSQLSKGLDDFWIVCLDSVGNKLWDKSFGGANTELLYDVITTSDGGYLLGGTSMSSIGGDKSEVCRGQQDYWIVKIDNSGNYLWDKTYGGTGGDIFNYVIESHDNGFLLSGYSSSPLSGDKSQANQDSTNFTSDYWMVKTDSAGSLLWEKTIGGNYMDSHNKAVETGDHGILVAGESFSTVSGDKTSPEWAWPFTDYWAVKLDSNSNIIWDKCYGGTNTEEFGGVLTLSDDRYMIYGLSGSGNDGNKTADSGGTWFVIIDNNGLPISDKNYLPAGPVPKIFRTMDGGYLLSCYTSFDVGLHKSEPNMGYEQTWVLKLDSAFNKQWDKTIFTVNDNRGYAIQTSDGCYAVATYTNSEIGGYKTQAAWDSSIDFWILKFCMEDWNSLTPALSNNGEGGIQMQVYPNPFTGDLSIALTDDDIHEAAFTITDVNGKVVYHKQETNLAKGYTKVLDLHSLPSGVYFVNAESGGECVSRRVVKE